MNISALLSKIASVSTAVLKYGGIATAAIQQVEAEVGAGNGNLKQPLAVTYILAAAHAGEAVPVSTVQSIATVVDLAVSVANATGLFGKQAPATTTVQVPAVPATTQS